MVQTPNAKELLRSKALDQTSKTISVSLSEKHFSLPTKFTDLDPTGQLALLLLLLLLPLLLPLLLLMPVLLRVPGGWLTGTH